MTTVVIPNWNGLNYLRECLASLKNQDYPDLKIIVVDNGSTDSSAEFVRSVYPDVKLIINDRNLGFAPAVNQGIKAAESEYIIILNNDTKGEPDWVARLVSAVKDDKSIGMAAPKVLSYADHSIIDSIGGGLYPDGMSRARGRLERDTGQFDQINEVLFPSGCAALYRRSMLDEIGLLDETFYAYGEDTDIGLRGRLAGWKAVFVPESRVYHHYSATTGSASRLKAYLVERNRFWIALKFFPMSMLILAPYYTFIRYSRVIIGMMRQEGTTGEFVRDYSRIELATGLFLAYVGAIIRIPEMIQKRRTIQRNKKISAGEFKDLLKRFRLRIDSLI